MWCHSLFFSCAPKTMPNAGGKKQQKTPPHQLGRFRQDFTCVNVTTRSLCMARLSTKRGGEVCSSLQKHLHHEVHSLLAEIQSCTLRIVRTLIFISGDYTIQLESEPSSDEIIFPTHLGRW